MLKFDLPSARRPKQPNPVDYREYAWVSLAFLLVGLISTWPLATHFSTHLFGLPGDNYGALWSFWYNRTHEFSYGAPAQPVMLAMAQLLSHWLNEVATYNLIILAGYPLAGLAIYLIVNYFTDNRQASWLAGLIYVLGPYHIYHSYVHLGLSMMAWLPLYFYALLLWLKQPKLQRAAVSGLTLALVILDNYYYGYLALLLTVFFVIGLIVQIRRGRLSFATALIQGLVAIGITGIIVIPFVLPAMLAPSLTTGATIQQEFERPLREVFVFSAHFSDYLLPSITHPLFGKMVETLTNSSLAGSNYFERSLYIGIIPLVLGCLGAWRNRHKWLIYLLLALLVSSIILSLAPVPIATWLHSQFPTFRVYARFGVLTLMATAILAGIGFDSISKSSRSSLLYLAFVLFIVIDFFPLWPAPMIDVTTVRPAEAELALLPTHHIIVYPLAEPDELRNAEYQADSRRFAQRLYNNVNPTYHDAGVRAGLRDPRLPATVQRWRDLTIGYVLIRKDIYREGRINPELRRFYGPDYPLYLPAWLDGAVPDMSQTPGIKLLHSDEQSDLYQILPAN